MRILSTVEQLVLMRQWVKDSEPFCHVRFNDGEFNAMFKPHELASNEHSYLPGVGDGLKRVFMEIAEWGAKLKDHNRLIVGSYWHESSKHDAAPEFIQWMDSFIVPVKDLIQWAVSDIWWCKDDNTDEGGTELIQLLDAVREQVKAGRYAVLIGNDKIASARHCLGAGVISVPRQNCWNDRERIMRECLPYARKDAIFIWCAGLPAKIWAWDIWAEYPHTSHIDAGHIFDGVFGRYNRAWLLRKQGKRWAWYNSVFTPYIKRFNP